MHYTAGLFIHEIIDDYRDSNDAERREIIDAFCERLWSSPPHRIFTEKHFHFDVSSAMPEAYRHVFERYSDISFLSVRSSSTVSCDFEKLKYRLNTIYTDMCDKTVCVENKYTCLLSTAKNLYFQTLKGSKMMPPPSIEGLILDDLNKANELFRVSTGRKLPWTPDEYKAFVKSKLPRIFENYTPVDWSNSTMLTSNEFWDEGFYAVAYIGKSITGYVQNEKKKYIGKTNNSSTYKPCPSCGVGVIPVGGKVRKCPLCRTTGAKSPKMYVCERCGEIYYNSNRRCKQFVCTTCYPIWRKEYVKNRVAAHRKSVRCKQ